VTTFGVCGTYLLVADDVGSLLPDTTSFKLTKYWSSSSNAVNSIGPTAVPSDGYIGSGIDNNSVFYTASTWPKTKVLLHFDNVGGNPIDESGREWTFNVGGGEITNDYPKFGLGGLSANTILAEGVHASSSEDFHFGTGDFEIEFYVRTSSGALPTDLLSFTGILDVTFSGETGMICLRDTSLGESVFSNSYTPPLVDSHILITINRISGVVYFYIEGISFGGGSFENDFALPGGNIYFPHWLVS
jgi:hypothetical protein